MKKKNLTIQETFNAALKNHQKNNFIVAENLYKEVLKTKPDHVESIFLLGSLSAQIKNFDKAKQYLNKTIKIQNNHALAHYNLGNVLKELGELEKAINSYQKAIQIQPNFAASYTNLGLVFQELGENEKAINSYQKAIQIQPDLAPAHYNLGNALKELGEHEKAINSYQQAAKCAPENLVTYYGLSDLKKEIIDKNLINKIKLLLKNENSTKKNIAYGNFLLSRYELQNKNYEKEFNYLLKGHHYYFESARKEFTQQVEYLLNKLPNIKELFDINKSIKNIKKISYKIKPIFIIGTPRCGSTLVEKIIASGEMYIPTGEETEIIDSVVKQKINHKHSVNLDIEDLQKKIIEKYKNRGLIDEKRNYTFTDKSLENFFYINLIKEIFPHAKVINCRRNALSSIMSILKNNLTGVAWAHNIEHIFEYFDIYNKMIEKFKKSFPNFIYELEFEKFANDPQVESKKLFKFCNLIWNKKCLEFHKRKGLVSRTASNIQIRKAIHKDSIKKYLPYKKLLNKYGNQYHWFNI